MAQFSIYSGKKCAFGGNKMNDKYKLVLFDFDYTLADSSKGATSCINYALGKMGLDTVSDEIASNNRPFTK